MTSSSEPRSPWAGPAPSSPDGPGADPAGADPAGADPAGADPAGPDPADADPVDADREALVEDGAALGSSGDPRERERAADRSALIGLAVIVGLVALALTGVLLVVSNSADLAPTPPVVEQGPPTPGSP